MSENDGRVYKSSSSVSDLIPMNETPTNVDLPDAKYKIGQVVWFYSHAGSTDDIIRYPCISRGTITQIYPLGYFRWDKLKDKIVYSVQDAGSYLPIIEDDIYPDSPQEAIKRLEETWEADWHV